MEQGGSKLLLSRKTMLKLLVTAITIFVLNTPAQSGEEIVIGRWCDRLLPSRPELAPAKHSCFFTGRQVGVLRDITTAGGLGEYGAIQAVAPSFRVELSPLDVRDSRAIQRSLSKFSRKSNGGLIVTTGRRARMHRNLIVELAARYKLPAVYPDRFFVSAGGLMSYGPDTVNQFRRAAIYVDRILKGEKTTDLPVQSPNKFELHINLKTAKALDLIVPAALISRADEVIE